MIILYGKVTSVSSRVLVFKEIDAGSGNIGGLCLSIITSSDGDSNSSTVFLFEVLVVTILVQLVLMIMVLMEVLL